MMQMGKHRMAASMLMNHYAPNQQPNQMPGYSDEQGRVAIN
jgi:hypothetical protein